MAGSVKATVILKLKELRLKLHGGRTKTKLCGVCEGGEAAGGSSPWHGRRSVLRLGVVGREGHRAPVGAGGSP